MRHAACTMMIPVLSLRRHNVEGTLRTTISAPLPVHETLSTIGQPNILPGELSKGLIFSAARGLGKEHRCVKMLVLRGKVKRKSAFILYTVVSPVSQRPLRSTARKGGRPPAVCCSGWSVVFVTPFLPHQHNTTRRHTQKRLQVNGVLSITSA